LTVSFAGLNHSSVQGRGSHIEREGRIGVGFFLTTRPGVPFWSFVHIWAIERAGLPGLVENQQVSYEIEHGRDGRASDTNLETL
jgi:cold shock CspA family protein